MAAVFFVGGTAGLGGQPLPLDPAEFQVNQVGSGYQTIGAMAQLPGGRTLVAWNSAGPEPGDPSDFSVQARRFGSEGQAIGDTFQINSFTTGEQGTPHAAVWPDGSFVVVWTSVGSFEDDQDGFSVQARRFSADGASIDPAEFQVNTYTSGHQWTPHGGVATLPSGGFVVVWVSEGSWGSDQDSYSVQMRRFDATGAPLDPVEAQVNEWTTGFQGAAHVAASQSGGFVVSWTSDGSFGNDPGYSIQARRFTAAGTPLDPTEFQVNTHTAFDQEQSKVAAAADGSFVVAWASDYIPGGDPLFGIEARRFDASGQPLDPVEFQVNTYTSWGQSTPVIAMDSERNFVVAWSSAGSPATDQSGGSVQVRRFQWNGSAIDQQEFQVNTYTTGQQALPRLSAAADGDFIVGWNSQGSFGDDQDGYSVQARRFGRPTIQVTSSSGGTGGPDCVLRDALAAAQLGVSVGGCAAGNEGAVIRLPAGVTIRLYEVDDGENALPLITKSVTILGFGGRIERDPTLSCPAGPPFRIAEVAPGGVLTLDHVTLAGGCLPGGEGGSVLARGGTVLLRQTTIESSTAASGGGVAVEDGGIDLDESILRDNVATNTGGGLALSGTPDRLRIHRSTIAGNVAQAGGAIAHLATSALVPLQLVQSTISGNFAFDSGGGLWIGAESILEFVTVAGNSAALGAGVAVGAGAVTFHESLVGESVPGTDCDISGAASVSASGFNLDTDGTCAAAAGGSFGTVASLGLSSLGDHGGATATHVPLEASPALDAATACANRSGFPVFIDQRGSARPTDGGGQSGAQCDLGSVEGALLFVDGFESGDTGAWSAVVP